MHSKKSAKGIVSRKLTMHASFFGRSAERKDAGNDARYQRRTRDRGINCFCSCGELPPRLIFISRAEALMVYEVLTITAD
jgi:hypothetical protein